MKTDEAKTPGTPEQFNTSWVIHENVLKLVCRSSNCLALIFAHFYGQTKVPSSSKETSGSS
ncbi:MAG: hypothetical protein ABIB04_00485, partial [Patescibacteria group bacterium]